ncbi:MAG: HEPN domain-containing protein [Chloroflexi bacterium]|nr:HEPN domain-containing protein [Chloroflexota bacterium]
MTERKSARRTRETTAPYTTSTLSARDLKQITRRIVRAAHPEMIILFGSRVYGKPRPDSDLDVLIVTENAAHATDLRAQLRPFPVALDVHTRTPDELTQRLEMGDPFIQDIVGRGRQVYPGRAANGFAARARAALVQGQTHPKENAIVVLEWVEKAEGDFEGALMWSRRKKNLRPEKLCWDCQQTVEKYLKAFLTRHRVHFERIHELDKLFDLCVTVDPDFRLVKAAVDAADVCEPKIRYPGNSVTEAQARQAFAAAKEIRKFVRAKLGLP